MQRSLLSRLSLAALAMLGLPLAASAQTITGFSPTYGNTGSSVTISGTGFFTLAGALQVSSVTINGEKMRITSSSALLGTITVTIPGAASTGLIRVSLNTGGTTLSSRGFRVTRPSTAEYFPQVGTATITPGNAPNGYSTPAVTDLNGDGFADILIGCGNGTIQRMAVNSVTSGTPAYSGLTTLTYTSGAGTATNFTLVGATSGNFSKPTVTDLDGDGLLDLLVGMGVNNTIARYEQTAVNSVTFGTQSFLQFRANDAATTYSNIATGNYPKPTIGDLDQDGLLDLLVGDVNGQVTLYEQVAANDARFTLRSTIKLADGTTVLDETSGTSKPNLIDIEGDGKLDLLIGNQGGNVARYEQTASNALTFSFVANLSKTSPTSTPIAVGNAAGANYAAPAITDLDNDGFPDLVVGSNIGDLLRYEQAANAVATPLPVTLTSFTATVASAGNQLRWTTAQEVNSAKFVVERSADGASFQEVTTLAAAGTSTTARNYQYLDATSQRMAYYRLRQVDTDGSVSYSSVVTVARATSGAAPAVVAFPNPFEGELLVALPAGAAAQTATVSLSTLAGQTVYSRSLPVSGVAQALPGLPTLKPGVYVLRLTTATGSSTLRVVRR